MTVSCLTAAFLIVTTAAFSYSWFASTHAAPSTGSVTSGYFARGTGTDEDPFIINAPRHLYNLSWLQEMGMFNRVENGKLVQYHFRIESDLDMDGYVIPPIGTAEYPFVGTLSGINGNVVTISNLTVSNVLSNGEINKRPQSVTSLTGVEIVGMFGVVGQYNENPVDAQYSSIVPYVRDLRLVDPEVRTQTENSLIGIVAGYASAEISNVGVVRGQIVSGANNRTGLDEEFGNVISKYALVGEIGTNVYWDGVTNAGGDEDGGTIEIYAGDSETKADINSNTDITQIQTAATDRAFIADSGGGVSYDTPSPNVTAAYRYNVMISSRNNNLNSIHSVDPGTNNSIDIEYNTATNNNIGAVGNIQAMHKRFEDLINVSQNSFSLVSNIGIAFNTHIVEPSGNTITIGNGWFEHTLTDGRKVAIPDNSIWFDPKAPGICDLAFFVSKMNYHCYKSVYRVKLTKGSGNSYTVDEWTETCLQFSTSNLKNGNMVCYQYEITQEDIDADYHYFIGASSKGKINSNKYSIGKDSSRFFFLALAGADDSGLGGGEETERRATIDANFIPENYMGEVTAKDYYVTAFEVTSNKTALGTESTVSFERTGSMTDDLTTATHNNQLLTSTSKFGKATGEDEEAAN